jgi:phospholipid transport system substrate-binding protein
MDMKNKKIYFVILAGLLFFIPLVGFGTQIPDPTEQMKPFVQKVMNMLKNADFKEDPKCIICQRLIDVSRERFDFNEMSKRVLGKTWRKIDKDKQAEFVDLFTHLLQFAYIGKLEDYTGQAVIFKQQRIRGKRAEVKTIIADAQKPVAVSYIMLLEGDQWMVYDVVIEGVSLVRNYMEQFREILRKEKYSGLVKQIKIKITELEAERKQRFKNQKG